MANNNWMKKHNILNIILCLAILAFIAGCQQSAETSPTIPQEQATDTGILSIKSFPSAAQVYVDGGLKGETPLDMYNFPVGTYIVTVKKDGYSDFEKSATVKVGMTEEVDAELNPLPTTEANPQTAEENKSAAQASENVSLPSQKLNTANINGSFMLYYDFKNGLFTETTSGSPDVFSSNYGAYVYFTAIEPSKMRVYNKPIETMKKDDCQFLTETVGNLYSGQTLCVKTTDGRIAIIGGKWNDKADKLEWILFS